MKRPVRDTKIPDRFDPKAASEKPQWGPDNVPNKKPVSDRWHYEDEDGSRVPKTNTYVCMHAGMYNG